MPPLGGNGGVADPENLVQALGFTGEHEVLAGRLGQQRGEQAQPGVGVEQPLPGRAQHHRGGTVVEAHAALAPQRPVDDHRASGQRPGVDLLVAVRGVGHLEAVADRVVTRAEVAEHGGGGGEVADEVELLTAQNLVEHLRTVNFWGEDLTGGRILVQDALLALHPGGVHHPVQRAEAAPGLGDNPGHGLRVGHIGGQILDPAAQGAQGIEFALAVRVQRRPAGEHNGGLIVGHEVGGDEHAEAAAAAGDQVGAAALEAVPGLQRRGRADPLDEALPGAEQHADGFRGAGLGERAPDPAAVPRGAGRIGVLADHHGGAQLRQHEAE